jgi:hypothetical protein
MPKSQNSYDELLSRAKLKSEAYLKVQQDTKDICNLSERDLEHMQHALYLELCEKALVRAYD